MTENKASIAWINGRWGLSSELVIEINDRGLNFSDGIFETILILNGKPQLLKKHLCRWEHSASILGMKPPPRKEWLLPLIKEGIRNSNLNSKNGAMRINWSRGGASQRGINIHSSDYPHRFWLEMSHYEPSFEPISTIISKNEKRNPNSRISQCKTFAYAQQIQARLEAQDSGYEDALLLNTANQMCCGTTANLIVKRNNLFFTPNLNSGCLPGIMRNQGISKGLLKQATITEIPLKGDQWLLINSLGCKPIKSIGNRQLEIYSSPQKLWQSLLSK